MNKGLKELEKAIYAEPHDIKNIRIVYNKFVSKNSVWWEWATGRADRMIKEEQDDYIYRPQTNTEAHRSH